MTDRNHHLHITCNASAQTSGARSVASHGSGQELHLRHDWATNATGLHALLPGAHCLPVNPQLDAFGSRRCA